MINIILYSLQIVLLTLIIKCKCKYNWRTRKWYLFHNLFVQAFHYLFSRTKYYKILTWIFVFSNVHGVMWVFVLLPCISAQDVKVQKHQQYLKFWPCVTCLRVPVGRREKSSEFTENISLAEVLQLGVEQVRILVQDWKILFWYQRK